MTQVRLIVTEDESQPFGHAQIVFPGQIGTSPVLQLAITRLSQDTPYLGDAGWQARPALVNATVVARGKASTTVIVGPEVCEQVPVDLQVKIAVDGTDVWGNAFWPAVTASMGMWSGELAPPPQAMPELPAVELHPPPPVARPLPPPPPIVPKPVAPEPAAPVAPKRRFALLLLLLLVLLGAGGWYLTSGNFDWSRFAPSESLAERFERLRVTDADGDELFLLSNDAYAAADKVIGQKALLLSVERRHAPAKLELARLHDPRYFDAAKLDGAADANQAGRFYFELALEGNSAAEDLLRSLCVESRNSASPILDKFDGFMNTTYCEGTFQR